jgi:hypothetical protein
MIIKNVYFFGFFVGYFICFFIQLEKNYLF